MSVLSSRRESLSSRFVTTYNRLLHGLTPDKIAPHQDAFKFWSDVFELEVDSGHLSAILKELSKEDCLGLAKPSLNAIVLACLQFARMGPDDDPRKSRAVDTLSMLSRYLLGKNLTGWEVMEIFAGGVNESDKVFGDLTAMIDEILGDSNAPASLRHQVLQLAVVFVSGISQLSPGAYFLRRDLFPAIVTIITSPETEQFTFEASVLLALLANFHKSDAAKLNPYLKCLRETRNERLMRKVCWASNFAADAVVKAYQNISDDSPPSLSATLGSFLSAMRPDRALSSTPVDLPRELFKDQPIEACVILLPIFEFLHANELFHTILLEPLTTEAEQQVAVRIPPLPYTLLTLASYLLTHASSVHAPRAVGYAHLSLNILLVLSESKTIMETFCNRGDADIRLCRQRPPLLPYTGPRAPVCGVLDCCVLWLRHNLHKRLEVHSYLNCVRACYHVLWYLHRERIRLDYHWPELWRALIGLLDFLASKLDSLITTGGVEQLIQETLMTLDLALYHAGTILPNATAMHELVYEVIRSSEVLRKQQTALEKLALPGLVSKRRRSVMNYSSDTLDNILAMTVQYEIKIREAKATSARGALRVVAKEIDRDGLSYGKNLHVDDPPRQAEDIVGMVRYAYADAMSLMP
ncbi:hypothetical protein DAEQUDRAFT_807295 [Daedalea quercina L-15889]|uniref:Armadillo-like helical domain-containing protein n=1 Tax=Daedalea quercina L-15889 TaxID=1314783 RepID=A0A165UK40_9APHY|nr:hypothetical protein DAEQUDRAFT_807295 [Daedalea quercina L-15889]